MNTPPSFKTQPPATPVRQPRPQPEFRKAMVNAGYDFLSDGLLSITKNLDQTIFNEVPVGHIPWTPPKQQDGFVPKPKGLGTNNVHYVVPKIKAIFGGRTIMGSNPGWEAVELEAKRLFGLTETGSAKTRNIDFFRNIYEGRLHIKQYCEIKKTTGCYEQPPTFLRSSASQLKALCDVTPKYQYQLFPSIYIIGSTDYDTSTRKWIITWWFIPCKSLDHFFTFDSSDFKWYPYPHSENDGFISRQTFK